MSKVEKVSKRQFRSIWISDVHLCSRDCRADYLLNFLKYNKAEHLYLVGDFIDVWQLKRRWYWPQTLNNVIQKVLSCTKKGTQVTYIPGNHDECLREFAGAQFGGVRIEKQAIHVTADGKRYLIVHGDEFDAVVQHNRWIALLGDAAYGYLIGFNNIFNWFRKHLGMRYWSLSGYIKARVKNAVQFVGCYEEAVVRFAKTHHVDGVICGHIHHPAIKELHGIQYCNTGDWIENCTALVEDFDGKISLVHWAKEWPDLYVDMESDDEETVLTDVPDFDEVLSARIQNNLFVGQK
jgi:UDP-2,3-diacylglucosamine pyrophosphatase LpxH